MSFAAFGMELDHWPPYASHVVLELWELPGAKQRCACDALPAACLHSPEKREGGGALADGRGCLAW